MLIALIALIFVVMQDSLAQKEEMVSLPLISQNSLNRKYLQKNKDFVTGVRSLVDNSYIPLASMEYQVDLHDSIAEVDLIQEYRNPIFAKRVEAEFFYYIKVSQAFVSLSVHTNGYVLNGVILDKNQEQKKAMLLNEEDVIPTAYAEILEDLHDVMRINLGVLSPGQSVKIILRYVEALERVGDSTWRLTLLGSKQSSSECSEIFEREGNSIENDSQDLDSPSSKSSSASTSIACMAPYDSPPNLQEWKINGQISSSAFVIKNVKSSSHPDLLNLSYKSNKKKDLLYFSLDIKNTERDFLLTYSEVNFDKQQRKKQSQMMISSKSYIGHYPADKSNPYAALIRFSSLRLVTAGEATSSSTTETSSSNEKSSKTATKQKQIITQSSDSNSGSSFLNGSQMQKHQLTSKETQNSTYHLVVLDIQKRSQLKKEELELIYKVIKTIGQIGSEVSMNATDCKVDSNNFQQQQQQQQFVNFMIIDREDSGLKMSEHYIPLVHTPEHRLDLETQMVRFLNESVLLPSLHSNTHQNQSQTKEQYSQFKYHQRRQPRFPLEIIAEQYSNVVDQSNSHLKHSLTIVKLDSYWNSDAMLKYFTDTRFLRVFAIGIGDKVPYYALQRISSLGLGYSAVIRDVSDVNDQLRIALRENYRQLRMNRYVVLYNNNLVSKITTVTDSVDSLQFSQHSHSLYVFFKKDFQRQLKSAAAASGKKGSKPAALNFTLRVFDEFDNVYEAFANVTLNAPIVRTDAFHKLAAHEMIDAVLRNALYRPESSYHSAIVKMNSNAYDKILQLSLKYSILSEISAFFLLDSSFVSCEKQLMGDDFDSLAKVPNFSLGQSLNFDEDDENDFISEFINEKEDEDDDEDDEEEKITKFFEQTSGTGSSIMIDAQKKLLGISGSSSSPSKSGDNTPNLTCTKQQVAVLNMENITSTRKKHVINRKVKSAPKTRKIGQQYEKKKNSDGKSLMDLFKKFKQAAASSIKKVDEIKLMILAKTCATLLTFKSLLVLSVFSYF